MQKGIHLLEDMAHKFVVAHDNAQIAIIGNGVSGDTIHEEICGRIAWSSGGRITYQRFDETLSMLGFAAASDAFGASLYEPCGQIDQIGNLYGTTSTNRDTGGYHDKITEISVNGNGGYKEAGNGFLFRDYDAGGLWYGLARSVAFHRQSPEIRERHLKRIMRETRERYNVDRMIDGYVEAYERLNGGKPLI
jgi:glycogen synthase